MFKNNIEALIKVFRGLHLKEIEREWEEREREREGGSEGGEGRDG